MPEQSREIGGYLELETFSGKEYHEGALALNCARNCLVLLIESRGMSRVWIPEYLCSSVSAAAERAGARVLAYDILEDFSPDYRSIDSAAGDYLYLVDYYEQLPEASVLEAAERFGGRVVVDEVQAFFRRPVAGLDTLYCCRKFFGVPDGAYLYTSSAPTRELQTDESAGRMRHLLGRFERSASEFYGDSAENDRQFAHEPVRLMSRLTHNLLRAIDYERAAEARERNFAYLSERLAGLNLLAPSTPRGAYMYPLLIEDAGPVRREMQRRKIYVPTLWPNATGTKGTGGRYARDILPLPVDQRYTVEDMAYVCDVLASIVC